MYELERAPHEALGRAARRLAGGGALYLGGGIGVERIGPRDGAKFSVSQAGAKGTTFVGPLSAVTQAYTLAGKSTAADTPGGATAIDSPAVAARVQELDARAAEARRDLDRHRRELQAERSQSVFPWPTTVSNDSWRARRIPELEAELRSIAAERARLLGGDLSEAEVGKPGTNWKQVSPGANRKLAGLKAHYAKMAHPFTACVRDNTKRFGKEGAERVCAVLKDLIRKSTKWRKGGDGKVTEEVAAMLDAAAERLASIDELLGEGSVFRLVEGDFDAEDEHAGELADGAWADVALLALAGHPLAEMLVEVAPDDQARHRDGKWTNVLDRVRKSDEEPPGLQPQGVEPAAQESVVDSLLAGRG